MVFSFEAAVAKIELFAAVDHEHLSKLAKAAVLFTDIVGAGTADALPRNVLRVHERLTRGALTQHGGTRIRQRGPLFMASFTSASGALDAAITMQQAVSEHFAETETPIRIRVGINAGEPIEEDDDLCGTAVIRAARIMNAAAGGEVLVSDIVRGLVAGKDYLFTDKSERALKGFEEPVRLYAVAWHGGEEQ